MGYIDDILDGTVKFLEAPVEKLKSTTYNTNVCDFTPEELTNEIKKTHPEFKFDYKPDERDKFAQTWPYNYSDWEARNDWGWKPEYDSVKKICEVMFKNVKV